MIIKYYLAFKKHENIEQKANEHKSYKRDPDLSSHTVKVFHNPHTKETVASHAGTNFGSKK